MQENELMSLHFRIIKNEKSKIRLYEELHINPKLLLEQR